MTKKSDWLEPYLNLNVVVDLDTGHVLIGELLEVGPDHLVFSEADLHDYRNANSLKEVYLTEAEKHGINVNRRKVAVPRNRMLAISRLEDAKLS